MLSGRCLPLFDPGAGDGEAFDWRVLRQRPTGLWVGIAGGLTPETVAEAVTGARPAMVDVSTGVESSPGIKDPEAGRGVRHRGPIRGRICGVGTKMKTFPTSAVTLASGAASLCPKPRWRPSKSSIAPTGRAKRDRAFESRLNELLDSLCRTTDAPVSGASAVGPSRRSEGLAQAGRPLPHRRAQDQQRPRPGPARVRDGQSGG